MSLLDVNCGSRAAEIPAATRTLLDDGERRIEAYLEGSAASAPAFVPSDARQVLGVLQAIADEGLAPGRMFCEWGSGLGVVACLAAQLNFRAHGIEIEKELVDRARSLAKDHGVIVDFAHGSFIPEDGAVFVEAQEEFSWLVESGRCGYEELCLDPDEFDIVFAYPWPGEESAVENIFEQCAAVGAILVTYRGREGVRVQRKA